MQITDREEAAKILEQRGGYSKLEYTAALNMAISALREQKTTLGGTYVSIEWFKAVQAELDALKAKQTAKLDRRRWEGCDYCAHHKDNVELCPMLSHDESDCDRGMYIHDGCLISNSGEFQYAEIKFCPMCGRPLTEEAEAALKKREENMN